jgi:FtsH-binding integral membrane protein
MRDRLILALAVVLAVVGWWALYQMTGQIGPEQAEARILFFALLLLTIIATLTPVTAYLNRRFAPESSTRAPLRYLRHSVLSGLCLSSWIWLQTQRAFNLGFAFIIALIFVAVEVLIVRIRGES